MAGYRSRSPSRGYSPRRRYSRSPPRRKRYDDPRDRYRPAGSGGGGDRRGYGRASSQSGLLIRNISLTARVEDIRVPFEQFGPIKDVYLPRNFHTRELRGFGFVKFRYPEDAAVAKYEMNHQVIGGREISIFYAEENRKTPQEMRMRTRTSGRYTGGRYTRRSLSRSPRSRSHSYSPSPSPVRHDFRGRGRQDDYSPLYSLSPRPRDNSRHRSDSRSPSLDDHKPQTTAVNNGHDPAAVSRSISLS